MCDEIDDASGRYGCEDDSILISIEKRLMVAAVQQPLAESASIVILCTL